MFYNYLNEFLIVARHLNISRAAQSLYISQPTLGKHISALEELVGVKLFIRTKHGLKLTESGRVMYEDGQKLISMTRELESKVLRASTASTYSLSILNPLLQNKQLSGSIHNFHAFFPDVRMSARRCNTKEVIRGVISQDADIGFIRHYGAEELSLPPEVIALSLYGDYSLLAVGFNHRLAARKRIKVSDLKGERFIHLNYCDDVTLPVFSRLLTETNSHIWDYFPVNYRDYVGHIADGRAIALVESGNEDEMRDSCSFVEITDLDTEFNVIMLFRKGNNNPALEYFRKTVPMYFPNAFLL